MNVVDNFKKIDKLLKFDDRSIYLVWLVVRNKDRNTKKKGNNKNRTIKSYFFQTRQHFLEREEEIKKLCQVFNCRAYVCINRKPIQNVLFTLQNNLVERFRGLFNGNVPGLNGMIDSAIMKTGVDGQKLWVVDVDTKDKETIDKIIETINNAQSEFDKNIVDQVPTAHGLHLITYPFDIRTVQGLPLEIKKEGLTLLYAYLNVD